MGHRQSPTMRQIPLTTAVMITLSVTTMVGVIVAAGTYAASGPATLITKKVVVTEVPDACVDALNIADAIVDDTAAVTTKANRIGAVLQDVYDAGQAGDPIAKRVQRWNMAMSERYQKASDVPDEFGLLTAQCRTEAGR